MNIVFNKKMNNIIQKLKKKKLWFFYFFYLFFSWLIDVITVTNSNNQSISCSFIIDSNSCLFFFLLLICFLTFSFFCFKRWHHIPWCDFHSFKKMKVTPFWWEKTGLKGSLTNHLFPLLFIFPLFIGQPFFPSFSSGLFPFSLWLFFFLSILFSFLL